jgi:hypothetical protein
MFWSAPLFRYSVLLVLYLLLQAVLRIRIRRICTLCFWASWIWIRKPEVRIWIRILLSSSKNSKKNIDSYCYVTSLWLFTLKNDVNVLSKSNKQKNLLAFWRSMTKIAGSGAGSISQETRIPGSGSVPKCHGSATLAASRPSLKL